METETAELRKGSEDQVRTWRVIACVAVASLAVMGLWGWLVVCWASRAGGADFGTPGAFGDSFAPIVGLLTSLALGAAIASVLMQRRELELQRDEMQLARVQYTAQAAALAQAKTHAARANDLAQSAQVLEATRQIADLNTLATRAVQDVKDRNPHQSQLEKCDPGALWTEFAESTPERRRDHMPNGLNTTQLRALWSTPA